MQVSLTPQLEKLVNDLLRDGAFVDANAVVAEALRLLHEDREGEPWTEQRLRSEIGEGIAQADRDEFSEFTAKDTIARGRAIRSRDKAR